MGDLKLTIGHFYPDLLNLYGDRGNVLALHRRAFLRGIDVEILPISIGDDLSFADKVDICFIGGGQDNEQNICKDDLVHVKGPTIKKLIEDGKVFLTVCGGYQMLGQYYLEHDGNKLECLGALDFYTVGEHERLIGDTLYTCPLIDDHKVIGFENHSGRTYLGKGVEPFMKVVSGAGNNGKDGFEGAKYKNTFCTYSHGSLLPKNPRLTDMLLELALKNKYGENFELSELSTEIEDKALSEAMKLFNKEN